MTSNSAQENKPFRSLIAVFTLSLVLASGWLVTKLMKLPFECSTYRTALNRIGLRTIQIEADGLVSQRRARVEGKVSHHDDGFQWKDIATAPPGLRSLPYATAFSVQEDRILLKIPDLDLCFLEIYSSSSDGLPIEEDDGFQRTRRVAERVYLFEAWHW